MRTGQVLQNYVNLSTLLQAHNYINPPITSNFDNIKQNHALEK